MKNSPPSHNSNLDSQSNESQVVVSNSSQGSSTKTKSLGWPLDRVIFTSRLSTLREVRNDLVHFNPDPLPEQTVSQVRNMIQLLRKYATN